MRYSWRLSKDEWLYTENASSGSAADQAQRGCAQRSGTWSEADASGLQLAQGRSSHTAAWGSYDGCGSTRDGSG